MKKIYIVREPFFSLVLGQKSYGQHIEEYQLPLLTWNEKKKVDEKVLSIDFSVFNYGMIFYSTEFTFPDDIQPEETYEEMQCRMLDEMNYCCANDSNKPFLKNKEK